MYVVSVPGPLGDWAVTSDGEAITGVYPPEHRRYAAACAGAAGAGVSVLISAAEQLQAYFSGTLHTFRLPLRPEGTDFMCKAWTALQNIPYGETRSYRHMAEAVQAPNAYRAVGSAIGRNPISVMIPCHRVVGADGHLTGYAGGIIAKQFLLQHEQRHR